MLSAKNTLWEAVFFATSQKSAPHKVNESTVIHSATTVNITCAHTALMVSRGVTGTPSPDQVEVERQLQ